jgi:hypothetical protein
MMLEILKQQRKTQNVKETLLRERLQNKHDRISKVQLEMQVSELKTSVEVERGRFVAANAEVALYRADVGFHHDAVSGLTSEVDELRAVFNEDQTKRDDFQAGLPPAFGSLDDEDIAPPWNRHEDSGILQIGNMKRIARQAILDTVRRAVEARRTPPKVTPAQLICAISQKVYETAQQLRAIMIYHADIDSSGSSDGEDKGESSSTPELDTAPRQARFLAERVIRLLIELVWLNLSAPEIYPGEAHFSGRESAIMALQYQLVDTVMLEALRMRFAHERAIVQFQLRLTQLSALSKALKEWDIDASIIFFGASLLWLSENVETERALGEPVR